MAQCSWRAALVGLALIGCRGSSQNPRTESSAQAPPSHPIEIAAPSRSIAAPSGSAEPAPAPGSCEAFLSEARTELLARGFSPTQDTANWLQVGDEVPERDDEAPDGSDAPHGVSLSIIMRVSADGASTWYRATVSKNAGADYAWRRVKHPFFGGEHANPEDHLDELNWKRRRARQRAELSIVYFQSPSQAEIRERALFESVAKHALDRCLDESHPL